MEIKYQEGKIILEGSFLEYFHTKEMMISSQEDAADYLKKLSHTNKGVLHPLFDFLKEEASKKQIKSFLLNEVIRNEVFDDETALLVFGLPGTMKAAWGSNLWDEIGHGNLSGFHTYWLRKLLTTEDAWNELLDYRSNEKRWCYKLTSNTINLFATRPGLKYAAYGALLIYESWVAPHFKRLLEGMERVGINHSDTKLYFSSHVTIDPIHSLELVESIKHQAPRLKKEEIEQILMGAHFAIETASAQFDLNLKHLMGF